MFKSGWCFEILLIFFFVGVSVDVYLNRLPEENRDFDAFTDQ